MELSLMARLWHSLQCPGCGGPMRAKFQRWKCRQCERQYPITADLPDLRFTSDRYLSLDEERQRARALDRWGQRTRQPREHYGPGGTLTIDPPFTMIDVANHYYDLTGDPRRSLFLKNLQTAIARSQPLVAQLPRHTQALIVEIGCGSGGLLVAAAQNGVPIVGIDIAARWLVVAKQRLRDHGLSPLRVPLLAADAEHLPLGDATVDAIVADSVVEHLEHPDRVFQECARVLKPGGTLHLWSPNRYSLLSDPHVGLWGVGFLPRALAQAYVRLRRGRQWLPTTQSARNVARALQSTPNVWHNLRIEAAPVPWPEHRRQPHWEQWYHWLHQHPDLRRFLMTPWGPVWSVTAQRSEVPTATARLNANANANAMTKPGRSMRRHRSQTVMPHPGTPTNSSPHWERPTNVPHEALPTTDQAGTNPSPGTGA